MKEPNSKQFSEAWVFFSILGVIMLNYPFLQIFNKDALLFGVPVLVLYFLIGWPVSILVIYIFSRCLSAAQEEKDSGSEGGEDKE